MISRVLYCLRELISQENSISIRVLQVMQWINRGQGQVRRIPLARILGTGAYIYNKTFLLHQCGISVIRTDVAPEPHSMLSCSLYWFHVGGLQTRNTL